jgi:AraC-like DNA-binding protein
MVCPRCISSVSEILKRNKLKFSNVHLGLIELSENPDAAKIKKFAEDLKKAGFELLNDRNKQLIEKIKKMLIQKVQSGDIEEHFSLINYLLDKIHKDYSSISRLFSETEGITIEQFFILQKIEKVKEWLIYNEFSLSQIAWDLGYSSSQHLSNQFKKVTGMTPSRFRELGATHRKPLDGI